MPELLHCTRCNYDLRAQSSADLCPECGFPVSQSIRESADPLHRARRPILLGTRLIILSLLLRLALSFWLFCFDYIDNYRGSDWCYFLNRAFDPWPAPESLSIASHFANHLLWNQPLAFRFVGPNATGGNTFAGLYALAFFLLVAGAFLACPPAAARSRFSRALAILARIAILWPVAYFSITDRYIKSLGFILEWASIPLWFLAQAMPGILAMLFTTRLLAATKRRSRHLATAAACSVLVWVITSTAAFQMLPGPDRDILECPTLIVAYLLTAFTWIALFRLVSTG